MCNMRYDYNLGIYLNLSIATPLLVGKCLYAWAFRKLLLSSDRVMMFTKQQGDKHEYCEY